MCRNYLLYTFVYLENVCFDVGFVLHQLAARNCSRMIGPVLRRYRESLFGDDNDEPAQPRPWLRIICR